MEAMAVTPRPVAAIENIHLFTHFVPEVLALTSTKPLAPPVGVNTLTALLNAPKLL